MRQDIRPSLIRGVLSVRRQAIIWTSYVFFFNWTARNQFQYNPIRNTHIFIAKQLQISPENGGNYVQASHSHRPIFI